MTEPTDSPPGLTSLEEAEETQRYDPGAMYHSLQGVTRSEWRILFRGEERAQAQQWLLQAAKGAQRASVGQQVALYQAAHAVQPLHGVEHDALVYLLLALPAVPLEWCDVLVEALFATNPRSGHVAEILMALRIGLQSHLDIASDGTDSAEADAAAAHEIRRCSLRANVLARQIRAAGYHPDWLAAWESRYVERWGKE